MRHPSDGITRRLFVATIAGAGVAVLHPLETFGQGAADGWPNRPVRFIVPLAAGGGLDFVARVVGDTVSRGLGQQVVIENRTGAGGTIGIETAIKSTPDGYAVLVTNDNVAAAPYVLGLSVDYLKDLMPVSLLSRQPLALAVHPTLRVNSLDELLAVARQRSGLGCATSGVGSNQHVLLEWFNKLAGIKLDHVPYRGAGQAINDFIAGHVQIALLGPTALMPHYRAGTIRLIAQSGEARSPSLPDVPTFEEAGFKGLVLESWFAAFVPLGTPAAIVGRLNAEMDKAARNDSNRKRMLDTATEPVGGPPENLARVARQDAEKYARLVKELNIRMN